VGGAAFGQREQGEEHRYGILARWPPAVTFVVRRAGRLPPMNATPHRDVMANWVGDYIDSTAFAQHASLVREYAPEVLMAFLEAACAHRGVAPADIEEEDLKPALLEHVSRLEMAGSARSGVPALCADFLGEMETQGRLGGGRVLGLYVRALKAPFLRASEGRVETLRAPAAVKLGRNDPCPCGSGRKYKKCCMNAG
jgi:hypothetical protein